MLTDSISTRNLEEVQKIAKHSATSIEIGSHPQHPESAQDTLAKQYQASTIRALRSLAEGKSKPDILRKELGPGVRLTSMYSANRLMRLQLVENKNEGTTSIHLLKVNHNPDHDQTSPLEMAADAPCTTYKFKGVTLQEAKIDTMVRFPAEYAQDEFATTVSTEALPVTNSSAPSGTGKLLGRVTAEANPDAKLEKQRASHTHALEVASSVLLHRNFDLTDSTGAGIAPRVIDDIRVDVESVLKSGTKSESFCRIVEEGGEEVFETVVIDKDNNYQLILKQFPRKNILRVAVTKGQGFTGKEPNVVVEVDLEKRLAKVTKQDMLLSRLKERVATGLLKENIPQFSFNPMVMERRFTSIAMLVDNQGGAEREKVVSAIAAIIGTDVPKGYTLQGKPRAVVERLGEHQYRLETVVNSVSGEILVIEEVLNDDVSLALADKAVVRLFSSQDRAHLTREWLVDDISVRSESLPMAVDRLKMTGVLKLPVNS